MKAQPAHRCIKVAAAIITRDKRLFIVQRKPDKPYPLEWEFPGGKLEEGETGEQALVREIQEELNTGINGITLYDTTRHTYPEFTVDLFFYRASLSGVEPHVLEHQQGLWVSPGELTAYKFLAADRGVVDKIIEAGDRFFN